MRRAALFLIPALVATGHAERINHAGRILGGLKVPTVATLFNTSQADAIVASMQICPRDSAWNEVIENRPLLANSAAMIAMIRSELLSTRRTFRVFYEMNYVLVPNSQPLLPISFVTYPDESDPGPYPIPTNQPIELWPVGTEGQTLDQWQRDELGWGGDRHGLIVKPGTGELFETWQMKKLANGSWQASNGAKFDLNSNTLRPLGWTSGDAAGLAMFPALIRYDEVQRGEIEHAIRLVVKHTRREYIYPATHHASNPSTTDPNVPAMGQRLRLKASFVIPATWTPQAKCVARALKKYGAIIADNGNFFQTSAAPDDRWPAGCFDNLWDVDVNEFEVVQTTGPNEGPRSPNPPTAAAGPDKSTATGTPLALDGTVGGGTGPVTTTWSKVSGPGTVMFGNAGAVDTTATFSAAGSYTLMLKAADAVHTPAYDALIVTVTSGGAISNLTFNPNPVDGGYKTTGTVTLAAPAPTGGARVWLSDTLGAFMPPTSVLVPAGQTALAFQASSAAVGTVTNGSVIATYAGFQKVVSIALQPGPTITGLTVNPASVTGGAVSTGTVTLSRAAPVGGATVTLASSSQYASVAASFTIPAGAASGQFSVVTHPTPSANNANVSASLPGTARGVVLSIQPPALALVTVSPTSVKGGSPSTGTVRLNGNAPAGGASATLRSNSPLAVVPASATVPQGLGRVDFPITTSAVAQNTAVTISATRLGVVRAATLTLTP